MAIAGFFRTFECAGLGLLAALAAIPAWGADTDWTPFTATRVSRVELKGAGHASTFVETVAARSDGSWAEWRQRIDGKPANLRMVADLETGTWTVIDGKTKSITTYERPRWSLERTLDYRRGGCDKPLRGKIIEPWHKVPEKTAGYEVEKAVLESELPPGSSFGKKTRIELWRAPALSCAELRVVHSNIGPNGEVLLTDRRELTAITPGEPDPAFFEIPEGYTERSPGEVFAEAARIEGEDYTGPAPGEPWLIEVYRRNREKE